MMMQSRVTNNILGIIPMLIIIGFIISKCFIKINLFNKDSFNNK